MEMKKSHGWDFFISMVIDFLKIAFILRDWKRNKIGKHRTASTEYEIKEKCQYLVCQPNKVFCFAWNLLMTIADSDSNN
jgi:hypothetical protein